MELRGKAAAIAAAFAILITVSGCASSTGSATATTTIVGAALPAALSQTSPRATAINDLAGLKPADVVSILGPPDLQRDEPPAERWQYRAADCVLNLFFYREAGSYRLAHAETWQRTLTGGDTPARCHDEDAPIKAHLISQSRL